MTSSPKPANAQTPTLALKPNILAEFVHLQRTLGVVGEETILQLGELVMVSRLLNRPLCMVITGPSGSGKSFLMGRVIATHPATSYYLATAMSQMAPAHLGKRLVQRILVMQEAAGLPKGRGQDLLRSLVTEGHIRYPVSVQSKSGGWELGETFVPGPTGLLMTNTKEELDDELITRLIVAPVNTSREQTDAIMRTVPPQQRGIQKDDPRLAPWHEYHEWLAGGNREVFVPFARLLGRNTANVAVRQRRDQGTFLRIIETVALMHRATRRTSKSGKIRATVADYESVYPLYLRIMSDQLGASVPETTKQIVGTLTRLSSEDDESRRVSVTDLAKELGWDVNYTWKQLQGPIEQGYVLNDEDRARRPARLHLGRQIPEPEDVLPSPARLRSLIVKRKRTGAKRG